jgi:outer membrane protein assembly factor BamA
MNRSRGHIRILPLLLGVALAGTPARGAPLDRHRYQQFPELESRPVKQILILGNNHTDEIVFRREMRLTEGALFHSEDLWHDWERIVDLGLFAHVEVDAVPSGDGVLVVVSVFERPRWFATPIADYDLDTHDLTVGYRVRLRNMRGRNESLRTTGRGGDQDRFTLTWETPWVGDQRRAVRADLLVELPRQNPDDIRTNSVGVSSTSFLGDFKETRVGVTLFGRLDRLQREGSVPDEHLDQLSPAMGIGIYRDTRNLRIDPSRGTFALANGAYVTGWTSDEINYVRTNLDGRVFRAVHPGVVVAARVGSVLTTGTVPDYRQLGIGGSGSIRGQPSDVETGSNLGRASLELRFPLLDQQRFSLPVPFVPKRVSNVDVRVDGEVFADAGSAWDDIAGFRTTRVRTSYGLGLRVFLPVVELVRLELAFDESGTPTLLLTDGNLI